MAHAIQIDTLAFSKKLKAAGADGKLAEAIVEGITAADTSDLATRADLAEVRAEIAELRAEFKAEIAEVRAEIAELRAEFKAETARLIKWMAATMLAQTALIVTLVKFL